MGKIYVLNTSRNIYNKEYIEKIKKFKLTQIGKPCNECKKILNDSYSIKADHIIPVAIGGDMYAHNLQSLCDLCHKHKTRFDNRFIKFLQSTYILKSFGCFNETETSPKILMKLYLDIKKLTKNVYDIEKDGNERININY